MPITGEFVSDFSDFVRGAKEGERALDSLEQESKTFAQEFDKAVAGLDFEKLMTNPIGGAKDAIVSLTSVLPPMVQATIAAGAALAGIAGASFKLVDWTADLASNLGDLSDKTGVSVPALSRLSDAAIVAGTDIGALGDVLFNMNKQMAEHPTEFAAALEDIGIKFSDFVELKPDERLLAIAGALEAQVDPVEQVRAGTDLLGRSYKDMGPALFDLADAMEKVKGIKPFTEEDAATAEQFKMEVAALKQDFLAIARDLGSTVLPAFTSFFSFLRENDALRFTKDYIERASWALDALENGLRFVTGNFVDMGPKVDGADKVLAGFEQTIKRNALAMPDASAAMQRLAEMTKEDEKATRAAEAEQKKMEEALAALSVTGGTWQETLKGMSGDLIENIKYGIQAGLTNEQMNTIWGAMVPQIKAVGTAMREEAAANKELTEISEARVTALQDLYLQYDAAVRASSGTTTQSRIDDAWRAADQQIMAMAKAGTFTEEAYAVIQATAKQTADNIMRDALAQDQFSRTHYEQLALKAQQAYDTAKAKSSEYTAERLEHLRVEAEKAKATLENWETAANAALTKVTGSADQATEALKRTTGAVKELTLEEQKRKRFEETGVYEPGFGYKSPWGPVEGMGGEVQGGSPFATVERFGQKYFINTITGQIVDQLERKYGAGGFIGYGFSGGAQHWRDIHIQIQGALLANEHDIATAVGGALTNAYRSGGNRQPV